MYQANLRRQKRVVSTSPRKGRRRGEENHASRLTQQLVLELRDAYSRDSKTLKSVITDIAWETGCSKEYLYRVAIGRGWK
jgi:hypothetical protein